MRFTIVTLFPEMFDSALAASVLGRAIEAGHLQVDFVDPREFATDKHRSVDDTPYGGGPGMVMRCDTLVAAIESIGAADVCHRILLSPVGQRFTQKRAWEICQEHKHVVLVCGRYEGVDERVVELAIDESLSIGDYVLTGGELAAMVLIDCIARGVPGVLGDFESANEESFAEGLLEYPQYTRPSEYRGRSVPTQLLSGHHKNIATWRRQRSLARTAQHRADLLAQHPELIKELAARTYVVLAHHPVLDRHGEVVTTSVTNLDIHDIARSCTTFGLAGYYPVSPIRLQREKIERIVGIWRDEIDQAGSDDRESALASIQVRDSIQSVLEEVEKRHKEAPWVVATTARTSEFVTASQLRAERIASTAPLVLVLGTGWGLCEEVLLESNQVLEPVSGPVAFNHLSVRSAAAAILDRLFGCASA
jgi:tRNA (guanine37-N1)-methyltransferase